MVNVWKTGWVYRDKVEDDPSMWVSVSQVFVFGLPNGDFSVFKLNQGELLMLYLVEEFLR